MPTIHIDGNSLTLAELRTIVYERHSVELAKSAYAAVNKARAIVDELVEKNELAYAITTGVGKLNGRLVILVDLTKILQKGELRRLTDTAVPAMA